MRPWRKRNKIENDNPPTPKASEGQEQNPVARERRGFDLTNFNKGVECDIDRTNPSPWIGGKMSSNLKLVRPEEEDEYQFKYQGRTPEQVANTEKILIGLAWVAVVCVGVQAWYLFGKWIFSLI